LEALDDGIAASARDIAPSTTVGKARTDLYNSLADVRLLSGVSKRIEMPGVKLDV
jgi:hypothetical protein